MSHGLGTGDRRIPPRSTGEAAAELVSLLEALDASVKAIAEHRDRLGPESAADIQVLLDLSRRICLSDGPLSIDKGHLIALVAALFMIDDPCGYMIALTGIVGMVEEIKQHIEEHHG